MHSVCVAVCCRELKKQNQKKNVEGHDNKKRTEPDSKQDVINGPVCCRQQT